MDRAMMLDHLEMAKRHISLGERHIREQQERISALDRNGHDTMEACKLLNLFFETQKQHIEHHDRLVMGLEGKA